MPDIHERGGIGRKHGRERRHHDPPHSRPTGNLAGVQGPGAAVDDHQRITRPQVVAQTGDLVAHVGIDEFLDAAGSLFHRHAQGFCDLAAQGLARLVEVQALGTAEEGVRVEQAEDQIGVGHRGRHTAQAEAGRTRQGAGRARTDRQHAIAHRSDGAAAGPQCPDGHHWQVAAEALHIGAQGVTRLVAAHVADVEGRSAHVGGDHRFRPVQRTDLARPQQACGGTGVIGVDGAGLGDTRRCPIVVADQELSGEPGPAQVLAGFVQQAGQLAVDVGVEHGAVDALAQARPRRDVRGQEHRHRTQVVARIFGLDGGAGGAFGGRIGVAAIERDDQAVGAAVDEHLGGLQNLVGRGRRVERQNHVGGDQRHLGRLIAIAGRRVGLGAGADDQADLGAGALNDGIRADSVGKTHHLGLGQQVFDRHAEGVSPGADALHETDRQVVGRRRRLDGAEGLAAGEEPVGEGAAGIDVNRVTHLVVTSMGAVRAGLLIWRIGRAMRAAPSRTAGGRTCR